MNNVREYKKGSKIKITNNFYSNEFDCKCNREECNTTLINIKHVENLQKLRDELQIAIIIESGYRCKEHNKEVGGATYSRHPKGDGSDIRSINNRISNEEIAVISEKYFDGVGRYNTFTHVDSRGYKARWDFRRRNK